MPKETCNRLLLWRFCYEEENPHGGSALTIITPFFGLFVCLWWKEWMNCAISNRISFIWGGWKWRYRYGDLIFTREKEWVWKRMGLMEFYHLQGENVERFSDPKFFDWRMN